MEVSSKAVDHNGVKTAAAKDRDPAIPIVDHTIYADSKTAGGMRNASANGRLQT